MIVETVYRRIVDVFLQVVSMTDKNRHYDA
jgi:hypothetical protein